MRKSQEWKLLPPCVCLSFPVCLFFGVFFQLHLRKKVSYGAQHAPSALPNQTSNINLRSRILSRKIASHTRTHTQTRTQRDCNCKQWGPICLLRCWPRGPNSNTTQSRQKTGYFQQCHSVFFSIMRNSYIWNISVHGSTYTCVEFMNACMSKITMMWLEGVSKATAGSYRS